MANRRELNNGNHGVERSSLDIYLHEINKVPLMTVEEEREAARRAKSGDEQALDQLVRANLRFVVSVAKRYVNQGMPIEDLINDGNLGLVKAAQRFDVDRGYKFISYAVWWIRQSILQSLSNNSRIVRVPLNRAGVLFKIGRATRELDQDLGRLPTPEEIAERIDLPLDEVIETMNIPDTYVSLDERLSEDANDHAFVDYLEDDAVVSPDEYTDRQMLSVDLAKALKTLTDRERKITEMYYGLNGEEPTTLEEIGKRLGLTRERIRQIKEHAIQRLRHQSRARYLDGYVEN